MEVAVEVEVVAVEVVEGVVVVVAVAARRTCIAWRSASCCLTISRSLA